MPSRTPKRGKVVDLKSRRAGTEAPRRAPAAPSVGDLFSAPATRSPARAAKPRRLRSRRRKRRALAALAVIAVIAAFAGGLGFASHAERFAVDDIAVAGAQDVPPPALAAAAAAGMQDDWFHLFSKKNIFLYPKSAIEKALRAEFPRIKDVSLSRESLLAQAVIVSITERTPFATWCAPPQEEGAPCYLMDAEGFIYAEDDGTAPAGAYVFRGGLIPHESPVGQTFLRGRLQSIVKLLGRLAEAGYSPRGITVENAKDFSVALEGGPTLDVLFDTDADTVRDLQLALQADSVRDRVDDLEYVDLRFGNRIYYKFKGEEAQ